MALDWLPVGTDRPLQRARQRHTPSVLTGAISPIPTPAPPTELTWQPQTATAPLRHRARRFQPIAECALTDAQRLGLSWLPILPISPARSPVRPSVYAIPFDFTPATIPLLTAWQTVAPLVQHHRTRLRQASVWLVDPTTLLNAAPCVELGDETLTHPILAEETLTSPSFGREALINPTLGSEDLC